MNIPMNEEKRRIIIKAWSSLSLSLTGTKDQTTKTIKSDMDELVQDLKQVDISGGVLQLTSKMQDNFAHACSYLSEGWKPEEDLTASEFAIYDVFVDEIFEADL